MAGIRLGMVSALWALTAAIAGAQSQTIAQPSPFIGLLTGHVGAVTQGDVESAAVSPGLSLGVVDRNGYGAELDISHNGDFDDAFDDSSITPVMLNFVAIYPHQTFRPFVTAGAGVMRVRVSFFDAQREVSETDLAWTAGGGLVYLLNEALGVRGDVRYYRHFDRQPNLPLGADGILNFVRTSIGVTYTWPMQ